MPGLVFSNELISRDEALHCQFACLLYRDHLAERLPECRVAEIVREAVEIEKRFCSDALPDDLVGMSAQHMGAYVEFVADELLKDLGCAATFGAENPFTFMDNTALETKTNFFERKVGNYRKSALHNTSFATTADF
jgi:ribonucleoside-diphosphate reductase beta chain